MSICYSNSTSKSRLSNIIQNPQIVNFRLTLEEREYYSNLYYNIAENGIITINNFPPLLGMLGTDIEKDFANKIFYAFSSDKKKISLIEYLTYIDIYHHGNDNERCKVTFKLIDNEGNDKIYYENFKNYIKLILNAVKKVNPGFSNNEILSNNEIKTLFLNIAKNKDYFTLKDFEEIYQEKPELISWIDYFKNNNEDVLIIIHQNINKLLKGINNFFDSFFINLNNFLNNENNCNLDILINSINDYYQEFKNVEQSFSKKISSFSIRNVFDELINNNEEKKIKELKKSIHLNNENSNLDDEKNKNNEFHSETDYFFKQYKNILKSSINNLQIPEKENDINSIKYSDNNNNNNNNNDNNNNNNDNNNNDNNNNNNNDNNNENNNNNNNIINTINIENRKYNDLNNRYDDNDNENNKSSENIDDVTISNSCSELDNEMKNTLKEKINNDNILKIVKKNKVSFNDKQSFSCNNSLTNLNDIKLISNSNKNLVSISNDDKKSYLKINNINKKPSSDLEIFLNSLKIFINSVKNTITNIQICYNWINENYLNSHIKKILKIQNKNKIDKFDTHNINAKMKNKIKKKIIKAPDQSFKILLNMIMGIQISVQSIPNYNIDEKKENINNYLESMIYSVQTINYNIKKHETFFLKEYAGIIFNNIRKNLGIDKDCFISSISPQDFITELMISSQTIFEELISTGKSGSLLYYTRDGKYIIKTIGKNEYKFLKKILPNYYIHLKKNPNSLLPKYLGCYQLIRKEKKNKQKFNFIVMKNVFNTSKQIHLRFDLKGSRIGRRVLKGFDNKGEVAMALKDLDLENVNQKFLFGEKRNILLKQLKEDTIFLSENGAIDYSLLIGIHNINKELKNQNFISNDNINNVNENNTHFIKIENLNNKNNNNCEINNINNNNSNSIDNKIFYEENDLIDDNNDISSIEDINKKENEKSSFFDFDDGGIKSINNNEIYFLGIIDILTEYNCKKSVEHFFKMIRYCSEEMSCIPPINYMNRFNNYMETIILSDLPSIENEKIIYE